MGRVQGECPAADRPSVAVRRHHPGERVSNRYQAVTGGAGQGAIGVEEVMIEAVPGPLAQSVRAADS
jgi:hypothetical protein